MDANLHQQQGINHLRRVLGYAPFVASEGRAEVFLTAEDWNVVADTLFGMDTPAELLPEAIQGYYLGEGSRTIELDTPDLAITLAML